ncbi:MAG: hypothetical protein ABEH43_11690, partial [Flavobacteriales bacterium]
SPSVSTGARGWSSDSRSRSHHPGGTTHGPERKGRRFDRSGQRKAVRDADRERTRDTSILREITEPDKP